MKTIKQHIYTLYKKTQRYWPVATLANIAYTRMVDQKAVQGTAPAALRTAGAAPCIAFICDEMTWQDFSTEQQSVYLTPQNWKQVLAKEQPELLFCESTWSGIAAAPDVWRGRVYKSKSIRYENRRELLEIISYCKRNQIPTAFWNKEDPAYYGNAYYDFASTALLFDFIFTTAAECVPRYKKHGHAEVHVLPFGASERLYGGESPPLEQRANTAVFAGSWYADQPQRCRDLRKMLAFVAKKGITPMIYDRQSQSPNPVHRWPEEFRPYLRPAVSPAELAAVYRQSRYAMNINTVTASSTMFARRVYELMLSGCIVISNASPGMQAQFPGRIWVPGHPFDHARENEIAQQNRREVLETHTASARLRQVLRIVSTPKEVL